MADVSIALRIKYIFSLIFGYNDGITSTDLKNTSEDILDDPLQDLLHLLLTKQAIGDEESEK
jgi:hypothetical protein